MDLRWHLKTLIAKAAIWLLKSTGWYDGYWNHWRTIFPYAERNGLHILPVHYYSPIPDTRELSDELWQGMHLPAGFDLRIAPALTWLGSLSQKYGGEFNEFPTKAGTDIQGFHLDNQAFRSGDAEVLYSILRELKPRKIIEIGSGYSTLLMCQAIRANQKEAPEYRCEFIAVEPYPPAYLSPLPIEVARLESKPVQDINLSLFASLTDGDILFIDSSHVVRTASDVVYEFLRILPTLAPGVIVHIHDIFIPTEYPRTWLREACMFWNEQYLLEAFLTSNCNYEVIMPVHALWRLHTDSFSRAVKLSNVGPGGPGSFWMRRLRPA